MKLKFKILAIAVTLGVVTSGFAAWNFSESNKEDVPVDIGLDDPAPARIQEYLGPGASYHMVLQVGESVNIDAFIYDEFDDLIEDLKPTATLKNNSTATYENGYLTAVAPDGDALLTFSYPGLASYLYDFTIIPAQRNVTFIYDNGEDNYTFNVANGETITMPADPIFADHTFLGWYNGPTPFDFNTPVTSDLQLSAHWASGKFQFSLLDDDTYELRKFTDNYPVSVATVNIPAFYLGIPITSIGHQAFSSNYGLETIVIPDSVTVIDSFAFQNCNNLTSITIPNSVTAIGEGAFYGCLGLESIVIPENVTTLPNSIFEQCRKLTSITIPNTVTSIGNRAFHSSGIVSIELPNSLTSLGQYAFANCANLVTLSIPGSLTSLPAYLFESCFALDTVILNEGLIAIEDYAFHSTSIVSIIIPNSVTSIGASAFRNCMNLTSITIPENVTSIGNSVFFNNENLATIYNNSAVELIEDTHYKSPTTVVVP